MTGEQSQGGAVVEDEGREEGRPSCGGLCARIKTLAFALQGTEVHGRHDVIRLRFRRRSPAVVWKLDCKRTGLTRQTDAMKMQARNADGLDSRSIGGASKHGCNPNVQESLVSASVLLLILDLRGSNIREKNHTLINGAKKVFEERGSSQLSQMLPPVSFKNWPLDLGIWRGRGDTDDFSGVRGMKNTLKKA